LQKGKIEDSFQKLFKVTPILKVFNQLTNLRIKVIQYVSEKFSHSKSWAMCLRCNRSRTDAATPL